MNFKVGDKVITTGDESCFPIGTVGTVVRIDEEDFFYPYEIEDDSHKWYWYGESDLAPISEESEETKMPKQKDLYDFDNMTDDDLDRLISEANVVLINRKKDRLMTCLDDALNALRNFQTLDHNTAMTSEGDDVRDVTNDLNELKAYYD